MKGRKREHKYVHFRIYHDGKVDLLRSDQKVHQDPPILEGTKQGSLVLSKSAFVRLLDEIDNLKGAEFLLRAK